MKMSVAGSHLCPLSASPLQTATVAEQKPAVFKEHSRFLCFLLLHITYSTVFYFFLLSMLLILPSRLPLFPNLQH